MAEKRTTKAGAFSKVKTMSVGPLMKTLNIHMVQNQPPSMDHDGPTAVSITEGSLVTLEYENSGKKFSATIRKNADDVLICEFCSNDDQPVAWCTHIHHVLTSRLDCGLFTDGRYVVPVVPSEGVFCPIHVKSWVSERAKHMPELKEVSVVMGNLETEDDDSIVIGYLRTGHFGNGDIRNLFSDWAVGCLDNPLYFASTKCTFEKHQDKFYDGMSEFAQRFYPAMYGMCPTCIIEFEKTQPDADADAPKF